MSALLLTMGAFFDELFSPAGFSTFSSTGSLTDSVLSFAASAESSSMIDCAVMLSSVEEALLMSYPFGKNLNQFFTRLLPVWLLRGRTLIN